jgi:type IV pilus assembly protein PilW
MSKQSFRRTRAGLDCRLHLATGFSLVELMIAMVLGLIVIAGAGSVFLASRRTYQANQGLSDVQQNARIAFELMARDLRQAGLNGCNDNGRVANVLNNGPSNGGTIWWANWNNAVHGYGKTQTDPAVTTGTAATNRVADTDSIQLIGTEGPPLSVGNTPSGPAANFQLNETNSGLSSGDVIIVCDPDHAAMVQVTVQNGSNVTLVHNTGNKVSPGNCSKGLGYPTVCTTKGNEYTYGRNSQIAKMSAVDWYIGVNPNQGRSLYRKALVNTAGAPAPQSQEMVRNVTGMTLSYHVKGGQNFVDAPSVGNWNNVDAVRMELTMTSSDQRAGVGFKPLTRSFTTTTTLRNRVQ